MLFEDFVDVGLVHVGVPDPFGVDDEQRALVAAVHAAGAVDAAFAFAVQASLLDLFFQVVAHALAAGVAAALGAVVALVGAEKDVVLEMRISHPGAVPNI